MGPALTEWASAVVRGLGKTRATEVGQQAGELAARCELAAALLQPQIRQAEISASLATRPEARALYQQSASSRRKSAEALSLHAGLQRRAQRLADDLAENLA